MTDHEHEWATARRGDQPVRQCLGCGTWAAPGAGLSREEKAEALLGAMIAAQRHFGRLGKVPVSFVARLIDGLYDS